MCVRVRVCVCVCVQGDRTLKDCEREREMGRVANKLTKRLPQYYSIPVDGIHNTDLLVYSLIRLYDTILEAIQLKLEYK